MKIGIVGDIHYCTNSSLVRLRGKEYSLRIENCIDSVNWAENYFKEQKVDMEVYLGDWFDQPRLTAEEITALNNLKFNNILKRFLIGNHEMARSDLIMSSAHIFENWDNIQIVDRPLYSCTGYEYDIVYLPYILQSEREPLSEYMDSENKKRIIFSHNDIAGINLGHFISNDGFSIDEIHDNCSLFINGHLHNMSWVGGKYKIFNVGNLTGQNFGEDGFQYSHNVYILDTDTLKITFKENPYAFNFYKITNIDQVSKIKSNAILTIKCKDIEYKNWKNIVDKNSNVITYRFIIEHQKLNDMQIENNIKSLSVDHLDEFKKYIIQQLGNSDAVLHELKELCE